MSLIPTPRSNQLERKNHVINFQSGISFVLFCVCVCVGLRTCAVTICYLMHICISRAHKNGRGEEERVTI